MIPLENDFLTQFTEVATVQEVVRIHFVRAVRRTHWNCSFVGTFSRIFNSHYVISQGVEHQEEENNCVKSCRPPQRCVRLWEDRWDEEAEVKNEGDGRSHEEVYGCYGIEESQF